MNEELFLVMLDERFAAEMERLDAALAGAEEPGEEARHAAQDFMADGFLLNQLIDPELDEDLLGTLMLIFFRGIQAMAVGWEPPGELPAARSGAAAGGS